MNIRYQHLALAILTVVLTVSLARTPGFLAIDVSGEASVLAVEETTLALTIPDQSERIAVSSQSEVLFFTLETSETVTVRYLTLAVESEGLRLPEDASAWKLYLVNAGHVDYQDLVGYGETYADGLLRLRLFSEPAQGHVNRGEQTFALVAPLYKEQDQATRLELVFPRFLPEDLDWEFVLGEDTRVWMEIPSELLLHAEEVLNLPSTSWVKE